VRGEHYFSASPQAPARATEVTVAAGGLGLRLRGAGGVFSADRLDPGTGVLLRKGVLPTAAQAGPLLDLGCGYGPITCVLASLAPRATVYAVDVNQRALELTRTNATALGLGARVVTGRPDAIPTDVRFAQIWSNPPIRVGKGELHALLRQWLPRLRPDGEAWLVVARHLGADSLAEWLREEDWSVRRHASQQGFRVLCVTARNSGDESAADEGHS
jgi:16S rRNA (guanine1207-N2)-methyltransferase